MTINILHFQNFHKITCYLLKHNIISVLSSIFKNHKIVLNTIMKAIKRIISICPKSIVKLFCFTRGYRLMI